MIKTWRKRPSRTLDSITDDKLRRAAGGATMVEFGDGHVLAFSWGMTITRLG